MLKINKLLIYAVMPLSLVAASCGDDDPESTPGEGTGTENNPGSTDNPMTDAENKEFLDRTAQEFSSYFRPQEQRNVIDVANYFAENFGDLELPDNFDFEEGQYAPARFMKALKRGVANCDPNELTRAATVYHYTISFDKLKGIYTPGRYSWEKTGNSSDLIFRFNDRNGQTVELKVTASSQTSDITIDIEDYDEWWTGNGYTYEEYVDSYKLNIPQTMKVTLRRGSDNLANLNVTSQISVKNHSVQCDVNGTVANLNVQSNLQGNDSRVNEVASLSVGGKTLVRGTAVVNGNNLCNKDKYDDADDDELIAMFKNATFDSDILGKVQIKGDCRITESLLDALDGYWSSYDGISRLDAERYAKNACATAQNQINLGLYYNGSSTRTAQLSFIPEEDSWGYGPYEGWEYYITPALRFNDGTTYSLDEYFEYGFGGCTDKVNSLIDSYFDLWDSFN